MMTKEEIKKEFGIEDKDIEGCEFFFAEYDLEQYSGSAYILFKKDGRLYEVEACHCSCNELEGQWDPLRIDWDYLAYRISCNPSFYSDREKTKILIDLILKNHSWAWNDEYKETYKKNTSKP